MGQEQGPEYYDAHLARVIEPLRSSPWLEVYTMAASLLPAPECAGSIADIGCGTGRFAKLLHDAGYRRYWGIDFSSKRVEEAQRYVPDFEFVAASAFDPAVTSRFSDYDIFTFIEVLEHITQDVELVSMVPPGALVVISLPNYDSDGHVRCFDCEDTIRNRFGAMIDFSRGRSLSCARPKRPKNRIFVLSGIRR